MICTPMRIVLVVSLLCVVVASNALTEEPFGVKLMRPDSLAGWDHGDTAPSGWTIVAGRLSGSKDSTPLLSGFTAGDFQLRLKWSVADSGAWRISLPEAPTGKGLELILREGERCGLLRDAAEQLAPGGKVEPLKDRMHTALVRRSGGKLSLLVDGKSLYEVQINPHRRFGLGLSVAEGKAVLTDLRGAEPPGESIFNGKDLTGWWTDGNKAAWKVEDGQLVLQPGGGGYVRTEKQFANFTLSLEYKMRKGGNSGVAVRTPRVGWPSGDGMELQFWDLPYGSPLNEHAQMAIYGNVPPLARADRSEQWNRVAVKADGWMISAWVNGELVQQCNTFRHPELKHRNLLGWIGFQDHGAWLRVRDIRVIEAPKGQGLDAWRRPKPPCAATLIVDRLLNPERLSIADGITSGVVTRSISGNSPGEHVLAELTGPGAIVRLARSNDQGRLAFYFDGEDKPRIEAAPGELWKMVPQLNEDTALVLSYLAYRKSLRIVLRNAEQAEYRIDYVTMPGHVPVETFHGPRAGFPRGLLSAALYHQFVIHWGVHREYDPMPRPCSENKTIQPGKTEPLVHVDGAGIVRWVKLKCDRSVLANNDLWLEATVDGEQTPAVSAPARYWYPGLVAGGNYRNYLLVDRNGWTNMLAMPFGDGITIAAKNCGEEPIAEVAVSLSVEPATERTRADILKRLRLRGVFLPASDGTDELIRREGTGRWVGLIFQQPEDQRIGIAQLLVDGKPRDGWAAAGVDGFLGRGDNQFRTCLSGRHGGLQWRYLVLAPVDFQKSLVLRANTNKLTDRLALFYLQK